jgi:hypothetical protein
MDVQSPLRTRSLLGVAVGLLFAAFLMTFPATSASAATHTFHVGLRAGPIGFSGAQGVVDTGLDLTAPITVTATGDFFCGNPFLGCDVGPDGHPTKTGGEVGPAFLVPDLPAWSLIAKVGEGPWQFVGAGPTGVTGTGRLVFAINDDTYGDNSGSGFDATFTLEGNPTTHVGLRAGPLGIFGATGAVQSGLEITSPVRLAATGDFFCGDSSRSCNVGPDGHATLTGADVEPGFVAPDLPAWSLIARIGEGPWQFVGSGPTTLTGTGPLVFAINDNRYDDNTGSGYAVTTSSALCLSAAASPSVITPSLVGGVLGGNFVPVAVTTNLPGSEGARFEITRVTQDEPLVSLVDLTHPDARLNADGTAAVRAETQTLNLDPLRVGDGRVYRLTYEASDTAGLTCAGTVTVKVGANAVDGGDRASWDSITGKRVK